jgi:hypothetical protein
LLNGAVRVEYEMDGTCNKVVMINVCHILAMKLHVKRPLERLRRKERKILLKWIVKKCGGRL